MLPHDMHINNSMVLINKSKYAFINLCFLIKIFIYLKE